MRIAKYWILLWFAGTAACSFRGCEGETVTLIYRGPALIDAHTQVMEGKQSLGFIDSTSQEYQGQRLVLRLRAASLLQENDVFLPLKELDGRMGLSVRHKGGAPLKAGAVIYYPPLASPAGVPGADEEFARTELQPQQQPIDLDDPNRPIAQGEDTYTRRSIRQAVVFIRESASLPSPAQEAIDAIITTTQRPGSDEEVLVRAKQKIPELREVILETARQANRSGDKMAVRQAVEAARRLTLLESRIASINSRLADPTLARISGD